MGLFDFLKKEENQEKNLTQGLDKTSGKFSSALSRIFLGRKTIDENLLEELEEILISGDIGVSASSKIIESVRMGASRGDLKDPEKITDAIKSKIKSIFLSVKDFQEPAATPYVILVFGINGVGKTTSIAKLASMYAKRGKRVMLAAGDTFRAAAADQLVAWGERLHIPVVRQADGSDPAAVIHDALRSAKSKNIDILIADTAGRLHNKNNLMQELIKIRKVATKEVENAPHESLLVIDGTAGQNAIAQAKTFQASIGVDGIILTKLDGTAKGGVAVAIVSELGIPIRYAAFGEGIDDLSPFNPDDFVEAIFKK